MTEEQKVPLKLKDLPGYDAEGPQVFEHPGEEWVEPEREAEVFVEDVVTDKSIAPCEGAEIFESVKGIEERCGVGALKELLAPEDVSLAEMQKEIASLQNEVLLMLSNEVPAEKDMGTWDTKGLQRRLVALENKIGTGSKPQHGLVNIVSKLDMRTDLLEETSLKVASQRIAKAVATMDEVIKAGKATDLPTTVGHGEELNQLLEEFRSREAVGDPVHRIIERLATLRPVHDACAGISALVREGCSLKEATDASLKQSLGTLKELQEQLPKAVHQMSANTLAIQARADRLAKNLTLLENAK